ncbi:MAG: RCC1 domain-containing protein [Candidatus Saccharimonadales bacterium]
MRAPDNANAAFEALSIFPKSGSVAGGTEVDISGVDFDELMGVEIVQIDASMGSSIALDVDGQVYAWGGGYVGDGSTGAHYVPTKTDISIVPEGEKIIGVSIGQSHSLALDSAGNVYAWGYNSGGRLGDGTSTTRLTPVNTDLSIVPSDEQIVAISAGGYYSLALSSSGDVYGWGYNSGQIGDGTTTTRLTPTKTDLSIVPSSEKIVAIAAGYESSLALDSAGNVYGWGGNFSG